MKGDGGERKKKKEKKRESNGCSVLGGGVKDTGGVSRMVIYYGTRLSAGYIPVIGAGIFGINW